MSTETRERERAAPVRINVHDWPPLGITGPIAYVRADVVDALLTAAQATVAGCYPCGGTGIYLSDFDFDATDDEPAKKPCGACSVLRAAIRKATEG